MIKIKEKKTRLLYRYAFPTGLSTLEA